MKDIIISIISIILGSALWAILSLLKAGNDDFLRSTGEIYVVVAVIVAIFIGIVFFLIYLDRKLTKLEHQINLDDE